MAALISTRALYMLKCEPEHVFRLLIKRKVAWQTLQQNQIAEGLEIDFSCSFKCSGLSILTNKASNTMRTNLRLTFFTEDVW